MAKPILLLAPEAPQGGGVAHVEAHDLSDRAVRHPHQRRWLWGKHIGVRIAPKVIDSSKRLGQRR